MKKLYAEVFAFVQCRSRNYTPKMSRGSIRDLAENKMRTASIKTPEQEKRKLWISI
ncbi:MAG: hypothetical protein AVDCRST_MAG74-330 [uncultured Pyrinomonadaceae bacterium]|uniref:Uncharacterized protein n=1 Tax=uncultured Pyrinomonadaceae bacterium TaxID=2283094 RepID=A0A6J4N9W8_9BACT|nr:MAG: hypothetical protein AVDCRST_MAG74-330 [uncultured Pyrinomonadaceae bacterium]